MRKLEPNEIAHLEQFKKRTRTELSPRRNLRSQEPRGRARILP